MSREQREEFHKFEQVSPREAAVVLDQLKSLRSLFIERYTQLAKRETLHDQGEAKPIAHTDRTAARVARHRWKFVFEGFQYLVADLQRESEDRYERFEVPEEKLCIEAVLELRQLEDTIRQLTAGSTPSAVSADISATELTGRVHEQLAARRYELAEKKQTLIDALIAYDLDFLQKHVDHRGFGFITYLQNLSTLRELWQFVTQERISLSKKEVTEGVYWTGLVSIVLIGMLLHIGKIYQNEPFLFPTDPIAGSSFETYQEYLDAVAEFEETKMTPIEHREGLEGQVFPDVELMYSQDNRDHYVRADFTVGSMPGVEFYTVSHAENALGRQEVMGQLNEKYFNDRVALAVVDPQVAPGRIPTFYNPPPNPEILAMYPPNADTIMPLYPLDVSDPSAVAALGLDQPAVNTFIQQALEEGKKIFYRNLGSYPRRQRGQVIPPLGSFDLAAATPLSD